MRKSIRVIGMVVAAGAVSYGLAAPAAAEGQWSSTFSGWYPGSESRDWTDNNTDSTDGRATFWNCRSNDGVFAVYRSDWGPDTQVGKEKANCASYTDAVWFGDTKKGTYHFTAKEGRNLSGSVRVIY